MKKATIVFSVIASGLTLIGCSAMNGGVSEGMSGAEAKAAIDKLPPEQRIRGIAGSPMPAAQKEQEYAKIEKETGVKAADVLAKGPAGGPGAGAGSGN